MSAAELPLSLRTTPLLDRWLRFNADGTATAFSGKVELGQGILTALAQIAAEVLGVPIDDILVYSADGLTWDRLEPSPVFDDAYLSDVESYPGGFVIVGRIGDANTFSPTPTPGVGRPAAWISTDGRTWTAANVAGDAGAGPAGPNAEPVSRIARTEAGTSVSADATTVAIRARKGVTSPLPSGCTSWATTVKSVG